MKNKNIILYTILFILTIFVWEFLSNSSSNIRIMISSPSLSWEYFSENYYDLLNDTFITFTEAFIGLIVAIILSFILIIIGIVFPSILRFIMPLAITSQVIPLITLAPLFIVLFGNGILPKILMSSILSFFPIFINFVNGIKQIDNNILDMASLYNSSKYQRIKRIIFPTSLPYIMTGLKIAATLSVIGAIVGEFSGAESGIGRNLFISSVRLEPELMINSLFLSSLLGILMYLLIILIEKKLGHWYLN